MYEMTSKPLVRRTLATLRRAEFGFFGVVVYTRVHTPRRCGAPLSAGVLVLSCFCSRPFRTSCAMVGNACLSIGTATANTAKGTARTTGGAARHSTGSQRAILRAPPSPRQTVPGPTRAVPIIVHHHGRPGGSCVQPGPHATRPGGRGHRHRLRRRP